MDIAILEKLSEEEATKTPFPGLRPFRSEESHLFFGRDGQSKKLLSILSSTRFLAIVGTSGSGKSSLARAGLLPALHGGKMKRAGSNWRVAVMRPGNDPIGGLAAALDEPEAFGPEDEGDEKDALIRRVVTDSTLRRGDKGLIEAAEQLGLTKGNNLLVLVDQFEELFRAAESTTGEGYYDQAAAFVKLLLKAKNQTEVSIYIAITMRSDFLGDCARFWDLPEAINEGQYLIPRMTRDERREAIISPLAVCGASITPRLVNRLINETEDNPEHLPLLQHALMRTWELGRADIDAGQPLDVPHYEAIGTMAKALSRHADEAYNELPDERSRLIAEKLFKRLTEKEAEGRKVRRPTRLSEICAVAHTTEEEVVSVIDVFRREARSFLMPPPGEEPLSGDSMIDISHESLIEGWGRLADWVEEEAQSGRVYRRLGEQAELHKEGKGGLYDELDVKVAVDWRERWEPDAAWARRYRYDFTDAMKFLRKCERRVAQEIRQLRILVGVLGALLIASLGLVALGVVAVVLLYVMDVYKRRDYNRDVGSALAANEKRDFPMANSLLGTINDEESKDIRSFEWNYLWWSGHNELETLTKQPYAVPSVFFASQGRRLVAADMGGNVVSWDMGDPKRLATPLHLNVSDLPPIHAVAFSPDGKHVATGHADGELLLWDEGGRPVGRLSRFSDRKSGDGLKVVSSIAFSPRDGQTLAVGHADGTIQVWDVWSQKAKWYVEPCKEDDFCKRDGKSERLAAEALQPTRTAVAFSPSGEYVATGHAPGILMLWDENGKKQEKLISERMERLYGLLRERGGEISRERFGAGGPSGLRDIVSIAFSPDGKTLAFGSGSGSVRVWPILQSKSTDRRRLGGASRVRKSDNANAAQEQAGSVGEAEGSIDIRNAILERNAESLHLGAVSAVIFLNDTMLASGSLDGTIKLWDLGREEGNEFLGSKKGHSGGVLSIAYSPELLLLVTGSEDKTVKLWEHKDGNTPPTLPGTASFQSVALSADKGNLLAAVDSAGDVVLWDTSSWEERQRIVTSAPGAARPGERRSVIASVALSPDGAMLATGSDNGTVKLWDINTGQVTKTLAKPPNNDRLPKVVSLSFSWPDGATLATAGEDGTVKLWDTRSEQSAHNPKQVLNVNESQNRKGRNYSVAFSPDRVTLAVGDEEGGVWLWDADLSRKREALVDAKAVTSLAFSADGGLVGGSRVGAVKMWVTKTTWKEAIVRVMPDSFVNAVLTTEVAPLQPLTLKTQSRGVISLAFNSKVLALVTAGGRIDLLHAAEDATIKKQQVPSKSD